MRKQYGMSRKKYIQPGKCWLVACVLGISLTGPSAWAQLKLPNLPDAARSTVQLPPLPDNTADVTSRLDAIVRDTASELDSQSQRLLRVARVRALLRSNPTTLETDENGAPVLKSQVISLSPTSPSLQTAIDAGFVIVQDERMDVLDIRIVTLQAPKGMTARRALRRLRSLDRNGNYDYNHVYTQSAAGDSENSTSFSYSSPQVSTESYSNTRIGLVDGGVDSTHPVFHNNHIHSWGCDQHAIASAHGTAVASLLAGQSEGFRGAAPGAELYAADIYCEQPVGGAITRIAGALAWLAQLQVPVINISLVGPDNLILKNLISSLIAHGHIVVAAVGNDGPAAAPLYPASYPGVIGVTAVDTHNRVLLEAGRGKQVMFAAPGADLIAATLRGEMINVRGTSFAAPLVAGLIAIHLTRPDVDAAKTTLTMLKNTARDLGSTGYDTTYGYGVVGESLRVINK